jgi:hypothetical protein
MKEVLRFEIDVLKRGSDHYFNWSVKNLSSMPFQFKPGMALIDHSRPSIHPRFLMMNFTKSTLIPPELSIVLVHEQLNKDKVDNYRFWLSSYSAIGLEHMSSIRYCIGIKQHSDLLRKLNKLAVSYGLPADIAEGLTLYMKNRDKEFDEIIAGNGTKSIIEVEYQEGYDTAEKTEDDVQLIFDK